MNEHSKKDWVSRTGFLVFCVLGIYYQNVQGQTEPGSGFAAVPGLIRKHWLANDEKNT